MARSINENRRVHKCRGAGRINGNYGAETMFCQCEEIADLFGKGRSTIAAHIQNILKEGELVESDAA
ncbi:hypothetical protein [Candidiatus Paracoxiella cheracis]|uniref:hypothetical protein n=1 Tax=Candidiatus Paracoxiella cheracis TaxID=3405120 RepID=UPI003BF592F7